MAEDSVVVTKSRPEKAGNRLEEKTGMTCCTRQQGLVNAKSFTRVRRDDVHSKVSIDAAVKHSVLNRKLPDEARSDGGG